MKLSLIKFFCLIPRGLYWMTFESSKDIRTIKLIKK